MRKSQSGDSAWRAHRWERGSPEKSRDEGPPRETACSWGGESAENLNSNPEQAAGPRSQPPTLPGLAPQGFDYSLIRCSPQPLILMPTVSFSLVFEQAVVYHIKYLQGPRKPQECLEHLLLGYFGPLPPNPQPLQLGNLSRSSRICCFYVILSVFTHITTHHVWV